MHELAPIITAVAMLITAAGTAYNVWNMRRVEKNTNSISVRNELIAKALGVEEGKAEEKANPTP